MHCFQSPNQTRAYTFCQTVLQSVSQTVGGLCVGTPFLTLDNLSDKVTPEDDGNWTESDQS